MTTVTDLARSTELEGLREPPPQVSGFHALFAVWAIGDVATLDVAQQIEFAKDAHRVLDDEVVWVEAFYQPQGPVDELDT